jgi:hypothetical protein
MGLEVGESVMDCEEVRETRQVRQYRNQLEPTGLSEPTPDPVYRNDVGPSESTMGADL